MSLQPIAPIYGALNNNTLEYRKRAGDTVVASAPFQQDLSHDFFVIQFARDPVSGSSVLNAQGFWAAGTTAAAFYFAHALLPSLSSSTAAWYVGEWHDTDANLTPSLDEITLLDSGT